GLLTADEWEAEQNEIVRLVDEEYRAAEAAADPMPAAVMDHLLGDSAPLSSPPLSFAEPTTMVAAVNQTLQKALEENPKVIVFGEDIEDPKGGVFGVTKGLSTLFPGQVQNAPLAEATILGAGVGLAATGYMPIFEVQFIDFISPALNQL